MALVITICTVRFLCVDRSKLNCTVVALLPIQAYPHAEGSLSMKLSYSLPLTISLVALWTTSAFSPSSVQQLASPTALGAATGLPPKGYSGSRKDSRIRRVSKAERSRMGDVMIDPDYTLTIAMAALCPLIIWYHPCTSWSTLVPICSHTRYKCTICTHTAPEGSLSLVGVSGGLFHMVFSALLWVQTRRVRLVFEKDAFEFYNIKGPGLDLDNGGRLERKPDNYVSGTVNRWKYDTITNYRFFPSLDFPFIVYFKETETPKEKWNRWFAAFDAYGSGQPHFFPGICNARQFKNQMEERGVYCKPVITMKDLHDN